MNTKILVVDDEYNIRVTFQKLLENEGYYVDIAADGDTAIESVKSRVYDVVVSDILLPKMSGISILMNLKKESPETEVIMITGKPDVDSATEAIRSGACDYLVKPVGRYDLVKAVSNALKLKALKDENLAYQNNLENLIRERTAELERTIEEIKEVKRQLVHQERLKSLEYISRGIAHDINNSLSPLFMYSETLQELLRETHGPHADLVSRIISSAEQIEKSLRKIEAFDTKHGTTVSHSDTVNVPEILKAFIKENYSGMEIELINKGPVSFLCNKDEFNEILSELFSNAMEASLTSPLIVITSMKENGSLILSIADEGEGMTEEVLEHCLDPYFTTKGPNHKGLGLTKVYGFVSKLKGGLSVKQSLEGGSVVTLSLPLND